MLSAPVILNQAAPDYPHRLIGQAVYRLYGLPDDEIAIVEGHHA